MMRPHSLIPLLAALGAIVPSTAAAQPTQPTQTDMTIDAATRRQVIDGVLSALDRAYVFPEKAAEMTRAMRARVQRGEYDTITSAIAFADSLTRHLQAVSHDLHLRVRYDDRAPQQGGRSAGPQRPPLENFGIGAPERLAGNVAYLELRSFGYPADVVEDAVARALGGVADADALIIDVRRNGGGSPQMVALVSSYLFGPDSVHLNSLYFRPADRTDHFWTRSSVRGGRFGPAKPVYVLTSRRTFSAAEEFTYNLQSLKRATIVGDTTGGGAHPGGVERVHPNFGVFVPSGRAINPITRTNWEGTGVRPDMPVASDRAREAAHLAALRLLASRATDPARTAALARAIADAERAARGPS